MRKIKKIPKTVKKIKNLTIPRAIVLCVKKSLSVATYKWSFSKPFFKIGPNIRFFLFHPIFEGCRHRSKAKGDQGSMQVHKNVGGLSMDTIF